MLFYRYNVGERVEKRHLITIETVIKCLSNCFFVGCEKNEKNVHFVLESCTFRFCDYTYDKNHKSQRIKPTLPA